MPSITVAPELEPIIRRIPHVPVSNGMSRRLVRLATRLASRTQSHEGVRQDRRQIPSGPSLRVFTPAAGGNGAALLWIHGGGYVIGTAAQDDAFCAETARTLGCVVVSTEYRLAPEHPFPAGLDDCLAAWDWLVTSAALDGDINRLAIGGQSAGGGLAAALVQRVHDRGGVRPAAQWLFCPMLDDRTAADRDLNALDHPIWNNRQNEAGWRAYLGVEPGAVNLPDYAAPSRRTDLHGLPPAWIGVGDIELFYAEDKDYAERLAAAGVNTTLDVVPGAPHGFEKLAAHTDLAQAYLARARQWLQWRLMAVMPA